MALMDRYGPGRIRWIWGTLLLIGAAAGCAAPTPPLSWDPRVGAARLILEELDRTRIQDRKAVVYRIRVTGLADGAVYTLWGRKLNTRPVPVDRIGFYIDPGGRLIAQAPPVEFAMPSGSSLALPETGRPFVFNAVGFARAEPFELALVDSRRVIRAFTRVIPFPISARGEGRCRIWLELQSPGGDFFAVHGEGFEPHEEIRTVSRSGESALESSRRVSADGRFKAGVMPVLPGQTSGRAEYSVASRFCRLSIDYPWGARAMAVQ